MAQSKAAFQGSVKSRSFVLRQAELSPIEQRVFAFCEKAATEGRPLESIEEIAAAIGATGAATVPGIMKRLEHKGYITRQVYQRGRTVCIAATGQCSAPPANTAPHWRFRKDRVPTPAIHQLRQKSHSVAAMIEAEARMLGKSPSDFLADLVYIGWHEYQAEKEAGDA